MEKRRNLSFKPIEPGLSDQPVLREVGDGEQLPSVCTALHQARLRAGYELTDVAKALRIQLRHLQALEDGRFDDLPGETYAVGFLKSYGGFLGLEIEELVARYKAETGNDASKQRLEFPVPSKESRMPRPWLVLLTLALAGVAYGGWQYYETDGRIATDIVADVSTKFTDTPGVDATNSTAGPEAVSTPEPVPGPTPEPTTEPTPERTEITAPATPATVVTEDSPEVSSPDVAVIDRSDLEADVGEMSANLLVDEPDSTAAPVAAAPAPVETDVAPEVVATTRVVPPSNVSSIEDADAPLPSMAQEPTGNAVTANLGTAPSLSSSANTTGTINANQDNFISARTTVENTFRTPVQTAEPAPLPEPVERVSRSTWFEPRVDYQFAPVEAAPEDATPENSEFVGSSASRIADVPVAFDTTEPLASQFSVIYVPKIYGRINQSGRVTITATADSWVQVQGPGSELLLTRILRTGDSYNVPNRSDLIMVTGNAGALEIRVDGNLVDPVGPVGVVRRNVALDPGRLLEGTAVEY